MANLGWGHWDVVKIFFRYLKGTSEHALCYHFYFTRSQHSIIIHGYVDSYWVGDIENRRSTNGYVFMFFGGAIIWVSKTQAIVTFSTTEAKYMVVTHACKEPIRIRILFLDVVFNVR
jgi:hypothetical protein